MPAGMKGSNGSTPPLSVLGQLPDGIHAFGCMMGHQGKTVGNSKVCCQKSKYSVPGVGGTPI